MRKFFSTFFILFILTLIPFGFAGAIEVGTLGSPCDPKKGNDCSYVPLAPLPGIYQDGCKPNPDGTGCKVGLASYLDGIFKGTVAVAGVLAFLFIVIGGFQYMSTDAISGKSEGKEEISRALTGFALVLTSYIILRMINPQLVTLDLNFGPWLGTGNKIVTQEVLRAQQSLSETDRYVQSVNRYLDAAEQDGSRLITESVQNQNLDSALVQGATNLANQVAIAKTLINNLPEAERPEAMRKLENAEITAQAIRDYATERSALVQHLRQSVDVVNEAPKDPKEAVIALNNKIATLDGSYADKIGKLNSAEAQLRAASAEEVARIVTMREDLTTQHTKIKEKIVKYRDEAQKLIPEEKVAPSATVETTAP